MDWQRYVEQVHCSISDSEINPRELTENGFFEWVLDRHDVQTRVDSWLTYRKNAGEPPRKNIEKATQYRQEGNDYFKEKNYPASVEMYTDSAKYSDGDDVNYSIAIANRSAAFFYMGRYNECLQDIELAIIMGYPVELSWKLYRRAANSHLKLLQGNLAEVSIAELRELVKNNDTIPAALKETILKEADDLSDLSATCEIENKHEHDEPAATSKAHPQPADMMVENSTFRFASAALVRENSPTRGQYVIAGQPIKKGEHVFVEKPFAWIPAVYGPDYALCAHCCGHLDDSRLPCRGCVDCLYCSLTCWNDAWSYHQWECAGFQLGIWQQVGSLHLGFKTFIMSMITTDKEWFNDVQRLVTNVDRQPARDIVRITIGVLLLMTYLKRWTDFFDVVDLKECIVDKLADPGMSFDFDVSTEWGRKMYVGSMLLRNTLQMFANPYAVVRRSEISDSIIAKKRRTATGTYPSASLLNHSCDPTVIFYLWDNWLIVKAAKDIREGEEIFVSYGPTYKTMSKFERQMYLNSRYCFDCDCSACKNPLFDHYTDRFDSLKCPECSGAAINPPGSDNQRCVDCGATSKVNCDAALLEAAKFYDNGMALLDVNKWHQAISHFKRSLIIREEYMYKFNEDIVLTLDALGNCYSATGNWVASISYLEQSIKAIEERYGPDSVEVLSGFMRMAEVCLQYLNRMPSGRSQEYLDIFIKTGMCNHRIFELTILITDPWDDRYQEVIDKRERLGGMLEVLRTL